MNKAPLVSICCATYNHEEYIEDALKGFLMQECDFKYEILIHDDASTDKTAEIIRRYEKQYPEKIFPIYQIENQYSQGKKYSDLNYERVRGKYVAICEGDDCWIDKTKLSKQIKLMESNPAYGLCFHPAVQLNLTNNTKKNIGEYLDKDGVVSIEDIIIKRYGMIPTASLLMTKRILDKVLDYKKDRHYLTVGDLYFQIFGGLDNGALYINNVMSMYRFFTSNSWSMHQLSSTKNQIKHIIAMAKSFQELNSIAEYKYNYAFHLSTIKRIFSVSNYQNIQDIPIVFNNYKIILLKLLEELKSRDEKFILYSAGIGSKLILNVLNDKIEFIIDADEKKENTIFENKKIYSLKNLDKIGEKKIIIGVIGRFEEVADILIKKYGINLSQIIYFDKELVDANILDKIIFKEKDDK